LTIERTRRKRLSDGSGGGVGIKKTERGGLRRDEKENRERRGGGPKRGESGGSKG